MNVSDRSLWYALYTKPRHEKFVESELTTKGIEAFTPKIRLRRKWSDRIKFIEEPLFKSYCFAKFSLDSKICILSQQGVMNIVNFRHNYIPIDSAVIQSLKILIDNEISLNPFPYLKIGSHINITKGPLRGVEGLIIEKRNKEMSLVISIDAIRSSMQCLVDIDCVELA